MMGVYDDEDLFDPAMDRLDQMLYDQEPDEPWDHFWCMQCFDQHWLPARPGRSRPTRCSCLWAQRPGVQRRRMGRARRKAVRSFQRRVRGSRLSARAGCVFVAEAPF